MALLYWLAWSTIDENFTSNENYYISVQFMQKSGLSGKDMDADSLAVSGELIEKWAAPYVPTVVSNFK